MAVTTAEKKRIVRQNKARKKTGESVNVFLFCALTQITPIIFDYNRRKTKHGKHKRATTIHGSLISGMFCNMYSNTHW